MAIRVVSGWNPPPTFVFGTPASHNPAPAVAPAPAPPVGSGSAQERQAPMEPEVAPEAVPEPALEHAIH
eukprot:12142062-Alexandrium_andersonii.AAC.1